MKKGILRIAAMIIVSSVMSSCGKTTDNRVNLYFGDTSYTTYSALSEYSDLSTLVDAEENFVIVITNMTCSCTTTFLPILNQYIQENHIKVYSLEIGLIRYESEHYGLPVSSGEAPVIGIYNEGKLSSYKSYITGNSAKNKPFTNYDDFVSWMADRIIIPKFLYITKTELDAKFAGNEKFIIYYGRATCPDCTYVLSTFMKSYIKSHPDMKTVFGLDVVDNDLFHGNNSEPSWVTFKDDYGLSNVKNTSLGYKTGKVPTFQYIEADGNLPVAKMSVIKDMAVVYNDLYQMPGDGITNAFEVTGSYYDGTRTFGYSTANLIGQVLTHPDNWTTTTDMHPYWSVLHEPIITAFFDTYVTKIN